jgi:hypothetical protein
MNENCYDDIYITVIRRLKESDKYDDITLQKFKGSKISSTIWRCFNFLDGDSYAWPAENITPEEVDSQYENGKRFFIFDDFYSDASVSILPSADKFEGCNVDGINQAAIKELVDMIEDLVDYIDPDPEDTNQITDRAIDLTMKYS